MLRWCLSTVRVSGGHSNIQFGPMQSSSTVRLRHQLTDNRRLRGPRKPKLTGGTTLEESMSAVAGREAQSGFACQAHESILDKPEFLQDQSTRAPSTDSPTERPSSHRLGEQALTASAEAEISLSQALPTLKRILSNTIHMDPAADQPIPTSNTIRSLYHSTIARSQLHDLNSTNMSSLISLYGSLSLSSANEPYESVHAHPLTKAVWHRSPYRTHWSFVSRLGHDKRRASMQLSASDHFFLMHTGLAEARSHEAASARIDQALSKARVHYLQLRRTSYHPDIHVPYISSLLSYPSEHNYEGAMNALCWISDHHAHLHTRILECLWRMLLHSSIQLSPSTRARLIRSLGCRVQRSQEVGLTEAGSGEAIKATISMPRPADVVCALTDGISGISTPAGTLPTALRHWSMHLLEATLQMGPDPTVSVDGAWPKLILLALVNSSHLNTSPSASTSVQDLHSLDWQTLCVLTQLERLMDGRTARVYSESSELGVEVKVRELARAIWQRWSALRRRSMSEASPADSVIIGSFVYVAGRVQDGALLDACRRHVEEQLQVAIDSVHPDDFFRQVFAELLLGALACGYDLASIFNWVRAKITDALVRSAVVQDALHRLVPVNVILAHDLYIEAARVGVSMGTDSLEDLALELARSGSIDLVAQLLTNTSLTLPRRPIILEAVLFGFAAHPRHPSYVGSRRFLQDAMVELLSYPHSRTSWLATKVALVAMLKSGQAKTAASVVLYAQSSVPAFLSVLTLRTIIPLLLRHRHFRLATSLMDDGHTGAAADHILRRKMITALVRGGAHHLARRLSARLPKTSSLSDQLYRVAGYRSHKLSTALALKVQAMLYRAEGNDSAKLFGMRLLTTAGRVHAAHRFFDHVHTQISPQTRTAMGNQLIHACLSSPSRRQSHRMKASLLVLKRLTQDNKFVPDRVTLNILVKGLLQWKAELDSNAVRALFDRLILSGYPVGGLYPPNEAPFGTNLVAQSLTVPLPTVDSPIDFEKHVLPLYKMFIKELHLRGDVHGARRVVGILKAVQSQEG